MNFTNKYANSEGVKIHYLDSDINDNLLTPLVYIPGALNFAEQSIEILQEFKSRRCLSLSLRGRGKSDAPNSGYSFEHHVKDIETVINDSKVNRFCLMAYSMGVPYAIKFASTSPGIKGLIICDYPAKYPSIPKSWSERVLSRSFISKERKHVVEGIQQESKSIELYRDLNRIQVPVLVIKGGTQESLLSEVETEKLKSNLPDVVIKELNESGHELWEPSKERFIQLINEFLVRLDDSR